MKKKPQQISAIKREKKLHLHITKRDLQLKHINTISLTREKKRKLNNTYFNFKQTDQRRNSTTIIMRVFFYS